MNHIGQSAGALSHNLAAINPQSAYPLEVKLSSPSNISVYRADPVEISSFPAALFVEISCAGVFFVAVSADIRTQSFCP